MEVVSTSTLSNQAQLYGHNLKTRMQLQCLPQTFGINTTNITTSTIYLRKTRIPVLTAIYVEAEAQAVLKQPVAPAHLLKCSSESLQYEAGKVGAVPDHRVTDGPVSAMEYVTSIFSAKVYDVAIETPLEKANKLSQRLGVHFWLKRETLQPVSPFSWTLLLLSQLFYLAFSTHKLCLYI